MLLHNGFVRIHFLIQARIIINPHISHDHYNNELISFYDSSQQSLACANNGKMVCFFFCTATATSFYKRISRINCIMKIHTYHIYQLSYSHSKIVSHNKSPYVVKKQAPNKKESKIFYCSQIGITL